MAVGRALPVGNEEQVPRTARALGEAYRAGVTTPEEALKRFLERIAALNPRINAFITVLKNEAEKAAALSSRRFKDGRPLGPLDGVPVAVKDIFYIEGVECTAGSKILAGNIAPYDSPVVRRLKEAGAIILGTTNLHEFAAGTTSVNPHFGAVRNPWSEGHVAGGSSGGSAAAVASGMAPVALGTDTAGSVRIPAALCGVVGLKPTYGLVSRLGVVPLAASLDTVGVLTSSCWDAAALLGAIAGGEKGDVTTVEREVPDYASLSARVTGARVGIVKEYFQDALDPAVEENFRGFVTGLGEAGFSVSEARLDGISEVYDRWAPIRRAEATAFHLRWLQSTPELYGEDVRRLLEQGKGVMAVDYVNAVNARPSYMERFAASMKGFDVLAVPCTAIPAPKVGQVTVNLGGKEVPVYSALNRLTLPFNYFGFPVISIPSGATGGLPLGVQLVGRLFDEETVLGVAGAYEARVGPFPHP